MKPENLKFLEDNRSLWITLRDAQYLRFPNQGIKDRLVEIMREEFRPGYTADLWCNTCVAAMVQTVYREFEKWEAANPPEPISLAIHPEIAKLDEMINESKAAILQTLSDESNELLKSPIAPIKANFPSHKNYKRR